MKKILFFWGLFLIFIGTLSAQREAANWYFGLNAGIRFNGDGTVVPLTDGRLSTNEGCASISDKFGNLLFYTDGITVWDRTHNIMPNGNGLLGDPSSTQSAIIVPNPGNSNLYYIFTVHALGGDIHNTSLLRGLNYYIVDMTAGPNGDVIARGNNGQPLLIPNSEKITAVRSADCSSIWVITHFLDTFYAYQVTPLGVNNTPVVSTTPTLVPLGGYRYNAIGYLKASPDGTRLAVAHSTVGNTTSRLNPGKLLLYDFDTATGQVSNEFELDANNGSPYGVEFSPNNQVLYATIDYYNAIGMIENGEIFQYDLTASDISGSKISLGDLVNGGLQLAINGKIYNSQFGANTLNVINNPNILGSGADFIRRQQSLGTRAATFGLPPFIQSLFNEVVDIIDPGSNNNAGNNSLELCENESFTFSAPVLSGASYTWYFDNGNTEVTLGSTSNTYTLANASMADAGIYRLEIDRNDGSCPLEGSALVNINPLPVVTNSILEQCDIEEGNASDGITRFNLLQMREIFTNGNASLTVSFYESLSDIQNNIAINTPENYRNTTAFNQTLYALVTSSSGCSVTSTLNLVVNPEVIDLANATQFFACKLDPSDNTLEGLFDLEAIKASYTSPDVNIYANREDATMEINELSGDIISENTFVYVRLENAGQCEGIEAVELIVRPLPEVLFPDTLLICLNTPALSVEAAPGFEGYAWYLQNGNTETLVSNDRLTTLSIDGTYRLELTTLYNNAGTQGSCSNSKIFEVLPSNIATISNLNITDISRNNRVEVIVSGEGDYEFAFNDLNGPYQDRNVFENLPPGFATLYVRDKNGCGVVSRDIAIIGYPRFFTPNGDGFNDNWQIRGINENFLGNSTILIFDRFGKPLKQLTPGDTGWDGTFNGSPMPASDYWFRVQLEDGREFEGHFSLKR
ncbi:T9SS type B sorting domain-containing protein [Ascidiimonas aurantiaca]|uniref:T9SS type B sorting domain-containing protein n=1 Tax=Ascidiimonas aurantiaca TaxID=1685432 RepID=UPI0030ED53FB